MIEKISQEFFFVDETLEIILRKGTKYWLNSLSYIHLHHGSFVKIMQS